MGKPGAGLQVLATKNNAVRAEGDPQPERSWLSVTEVSSILDIPDRRLRRYLDRHESLVETRRTGRKHLIASDAVAALRRIRDLYDEGATARDIDDALASRQLPTTTTAAKPGGLSEGTKALANAVLTAAAAKQLTDLRQQVTTLRSKVSELGSTLEQRDRVLRRALVAIVDLFQYNENERQLAESERDRDNAHHRQRTLLALQELLMHSRKKRKWW